MMQIFTVVFQGGMYLFYLWDSMAAGVTLLLCVFFQAVAIGWFYGKIMSYPLPLLTFQRYFKNTTCINIRQHTKKIIKNHQLTLQEYPCSLTLLQERILL